MVDPRSGRVHDDARVDGDLLAVRAHVRPADPARVEAKRDDPRAVEDARSRVRGRAHVLEAQSRVVRRRVRVQRARTQPVDAQWRDELARSVRRHEPVEPRARERRVDDDPALDERRPVRTALVQGQEKRQAADEMRRDDPGQQPPLVMCLPYETHVAEAQVAQAAVDELRRRARGRPAEVARVDERDREPGPSGVGRDPRSDDPGADHEQVESPLGQLVDGSSTRL